MTALATPLVDAVLPLVPVRQWMLTFRLSDYPYRRAALLGLGAPSELPPL
jgi:hypothetical protein